jgi:low affinity Fe/Cu permease
MATTPKAKGRQVTANLKEGGARAPHSPSRVFSDLAQITAREVGRAWVFALAMGTVLVWAITGPLFHFSDTWQLVINTGTTIVTFLMVFLIQNSQNRDAAAIQVKLDELIRVSRANNSLVGVEHLTDEELEEIRTRCESRAQAELARRDAARKVNGRRVPVRSAHP